VPPAPAAAWSWSAPARPASRTPTWPPTSSPPPARRPGVDIHVETQGSSGSTPLDPAVIRAADAVIFAVDVGVRDRDRFAGKPLVQSGTKRAINEPDVMVREALAAADDPNARRVPGGAGGAAEPAAATGDRPGAGTEIRRWLLTGVSYMIPFVAAGGLLIALGFLFGGYQIVNPDPSSADGNSYALNWALNNTFFNLPDAAPLEGLNDGFWGYLGAVCTVLGQAAFGFLVPALAGYIAYAIADRPASSPASSSASSPSRWAPASSAASSAASSPASPRCGSAAGSCPSASAACSRS
jgi:PTS system fructose-specific IIC component